MTDQPITHEWLRANFFREAPPQERQTSPHYRRAIAGEVLGGRSPLTSPDDLCIELAEGQGGDWFCWILQVEPYRHIHVRHMRKQWDVIRLWEGLTGRIWGAND